MSLRRNPIAYLFFLSANNPSLACIVIKEGLKIIIIRYSCIRATRPSVKKVGQDITRFFQNLWCCLHSYIIIYPAHSETTTVRRLYYIRRVRYMGTIKNVINTTVSKYLFRRLYLKQGTIRVAITTKFPILLTFGFVNVILLYAESLKTVLYILLIIIGWRLFERKSFPSFVL